MNDLRIFWEIRFFIQILCFHCAKSKRIRPKPRIVIFDGIYIKKRTIKRLHIRETDIFMNGIFQYAHCASGIFPPSSEIVISADRRPPPISADFPGRKRVSRDPPVALGRSAAAFGEDAGEIARKKKFWACEKTCLLCKQAKKGICRTIR